MRSGFTIIEVLVALLAASIIALMSFEYLSNVVNLETKVKIKISIKNFGIEARYLYLSYLKVKQEERFQRHFLEIKIIL